MTPSGLQDFVRRHGYALATAALILTGVAVRLALVLAGWPHTNSEESAMGLEALHIFARGDRPIYLYGQNYMGVGEAYLGGLAFHLAGVSIASLRLGMIALYAAFMVGVSWLARLLYSRRVALVALAALVVGTPFTLRIQLLADGGKAETLAFGALLVALASWLALTPPPAADAHRARWAWRYAAYAGWGLLAGLGLYTYAIIAPFVLASGLLIAATCWRELRSWAVAAPIAGLVAGLLPAILYTVTSPLAQNPLAVFLGLHHSLNARGATGLPLLIRQFDATLLYTLPQVTGLAAQYPLSALPLYGPPSGATLMAVILGGGWSVAYLALLGRATWRAARGLTPRPPLPAGRGGVSVAAGETGARDAARLALALAGWLTLAGYLFSATAANNPYSGRYMIGMLILTPALLWPLLEWVPGAWLRDGWRAALLAGLAASLAFGTVAAFRGAPDAAAADARDTRFASALLSHGITRYYADYWTCDVLNFATRERAICAVVNDYGRPGLTRYAPYAALVRADPRAPYILARGSEVERTFLIEAAQTHKRYTKSVIDGHDMYTPVAS
ncbi:MAG TPA: hypothetical protein VF808_16170 [Ktedonobacterales bacterium]